MAAESPDPLVEERALRIIETTIELAEQGGFEAVRLRDVAAHAGVALGTLYRRFDSKEDLLVAALELETRALAKRVTERPPNGATPSERVIGFFSVATRGMLRRANLSRAMLRASTAGMPALAAKVGVFHDLTLRMIVGAMRGEPIGPDDPVAFGPGERLLGEILNEIWFARMVGWAGGQQTQASINEHMRMSVEMILDRAVREDRAGK